MSRRFAFLRGVNLGRRTTKSADLIAAFRSLGFEEVATFLASGNVTFEGGEASDETLAAQIEEGLEKTFGFEVATFIRSCGELAAAASPDRLASSPLAGDEGLTLNVAFFRNRVPDDVREAIAGLRSTDDDFVSHGRELYWLRQGKMSDSPAWAGLEKALAGRCTMRNLNTVRRLLAKFCEGEA